MWLDHLVRKDTDGHLVISDVGVGVTITTAGTVSGTQCVTGDSFGRRLLCRTMFTSSQTDESSRIKFYLKTHQFSLNPEPGGIGSLD